jgi:hypothetical protein
MRKYLADLLRLFILVSLLLLALLSIPKNAPPDKTPAIGKLQIKQNFTPVTNSVTAAQRESSF